MDNKGEGKKQLLVLMAVLAVIAFVATTAAATTFLGLTDTPAAYSGSGGEYVRVNAGETALEFVAGGIDFGDYIDLPEAAEPASPAADNLRLFSLDDNGFSILAFKDSGGMVRKFVKDTVFIGYNNSGSTIAAARIVYASGSTGNVPEISLAKADSSTTMPAVGVTIETIANGAYGRIMQTGILEDVNTSSYSTGDILYVSATTAGIPTSTAPLSPNLRQEIGTILVDDPAVGSIQIVARTAFDDSLVPQSSATYILKAADATGGWAGADATCSGTCDDEIQTGLDALASGNGTLQLTEGTYTWADVTVTANQSNLVIQGMGDATVLDLSATTTSDRGIEFTGSYGDSSALTANADKMDSVIAVTDGTKFAAGDWVRLRAETLWEGAAGYRIGEIHQVASVATNNVTLTDYIFDDYTTADTATLEVANMLENIVVRDLKIVSASATGDTIALDFNICHNVGVFNITTENIGYASVEFEDVVDSIIANSSISGNARGATGYGVMHVNASQHGRVIGNYFEDCRHAYTLGSDADYGVNRFIVVQGNTVIGSSNNSGGAFNTHFNGEHILIDGNTVVNDLLVTLSAPYTTVSNNIQNSSRAGTGGRSIYITEAIHHVNFINNDCTGEDVAITFANASEGWAHIYFEGNKFRGHTGKMLACNVGGSHISIINNEFDMANSNSADGVALNASAGTTAITNVYIIGNIFLDADEESITMYAGTGDISKVIIANNMVDANGYIGMKFSDDNGGTDNMHDVVIEGNTIYDATDAIHVEDYSDDFIIRGNTAINSTKPWDITLNASAASVMMITDNYGNGCSGNGTVSGAAATFLISTNVANDGTWFTGDDPG